MFKKNKFFLSAIFFLLFIVMGYAGYKVHSLSEAQEDVKEDYATANSISFGLLSVNQWRDQIEEIITHQIQKILIFFTRTKKRRLKKEIEEILHALIDKTVKTINKPKKSLKGKLSKFAFNTFVDEDELHKQVPAYAHEIVAQIDKPSSKQRLKDIAQSKVQELGKQIYDSTKAANDSVMNIIYKKYHVANADEYEKKDRNLAYSTKKRRL